MTQVEFTSKLQHKGNVTVFEGQLNAGTEVLQVKGPFELHGDIESGVTLTVEGDLTVKGSVFESTLTVTGNVVIDQAFTGGGKGKIEAGGNVSIAVINGQSVAAKGNITIGVEAIRAEIIAYGNIDAKNARIIGGKIEAGTEIVVKMLGNEEGHQTKVYLGNRKKLIQRLTDISNEEKRLKESLPKINDGIYKLNRLKVDGIALTPEQETMASRLRAMRDSVPRQMELFKKEVERVNELLREKSNATLNIRDSIYENVMVDINGFKEVTESPLRALCYKMGSTGLLKTPLR